MADEGSVTVWIGRLKAGDGRDEVVSRLWGRYFTRLVTHARDRLKARTRVADGEDVALAAFDSFVRAAGAGRFPRLDDRDDLWQVLLMLTARKAANAARDERRLKAGGGRAVVGLGGDSDAGDTPVVSPAPDPAEAAALAEEADHLLQTLRDDELRRVAVWALEGYSNEEIAGLMGRSVATAERKLKRIRELWSKSAAGTDPPDGH